MIINKNNQGVKRERKNTPGMQEQLRPYKGTLLKTLQQQI